MPGATLTLDVDLNDDDDFLDAGESGYATAASSDGYAIVKLPALASTGTSRVRARATDLAGNEGTSAASTFTVSAVGSAWVATAQALSVQPSAGSFGAVLGDVSVAHALDLGRSPGTPSGAVTPGTPVGSSAAPARRTPAAAAPPPGFPPRLRRRTHVAPLARFTSVSPPRPAW